MTRGRLARWGLIIVTAGACALGGAPRALSQQRDVSRFLAERWSGTFTVAVTGTGLPVTTTVEHRTFSGTTSGQVTLVRNPAKDDGESRVWEGNATATIQSRETRAFGVPGLPTAIEGTLVESGQVTAPATLTIDVESMEYTFDVDVSDSQVNFSCSGSVAGYAGPQPFSGAGRTSAADTLDRQQPSQRCNDGLQCHFAWQHGTHDPANSLAQSGLSAVLKSAKTQCFL